MTALDLDALLALLDAASPRPWEAPGGHASGAVEDADGRTLVYDEGVPSPADAALIVAAVNALPELVAKAREADRLRQWKAEAVAVLEGWEAVWEALGRPGTLGQSKSAAVLAALSPSDGVDD